MRKLGVLTSLCALFLLGSFAQAQQADAMFGFGTVLSSGSSTCTVSSCVVPEKGGLYPSFSADVIFKNRLGFNGEVSWRAKSERPFSTLALADRMGKSICLNSGRWNNQSV